MRKSLPSLLIIAVFITLNFQIAQAQTIKPLYLSPRPNAEYVSRGTKIAIRYGIPISVASVQTTSITILGSASGQQYGKGILADDTETVIFEPAHPFEPGETVQINIPDRLRGKNNEALEGVQFKFTVSSKTVLSAEESGWIPETAPTQSSNPQKLSFRANGSSTVFSTEGYLTIPQPFPSYSVTSLSEAEDEGFIFLAPFLWGANNSKELSNYLFIMDNSGNLVYYKKAITNQIFSDFKVQADQTITYTDDIDRTYHVLNHAYQTIGSWKAGNGYIADNHDLQILSNGHALMLIYDPQPVDMSKVIAGGKKDAVVVGLVLQELDSEKNVVFEWRSWDHFSLSETTASLTESWIDAVHGNAIELDHDGNWLISSRHMDEITKINRQTGDIIWRLGGKANQFTFLNDPRGIHHQHDIRRLSNGNITLFDNGVNPGQLNSRAVEYHLDEVAKTATMIWEYQGTNAEYALAMGNQQRLANGNTMIGWGSSNTTAIREVKPNGDTVFELSFLQPTDQPTPYYVTYRAFRFPWVGEPLDPPALAGVKGNEQLKLGFSWNGSTQVASWEILAGNTPNNLHLLTTRAKNGFETQIDLTGEDAAYCLYRVVALDEEGTPLKQSNDFVPAGCTPYRISLPIVN